MVVPPVQRPCEKLVVTCGEVEWPLTLGLTDDFPVLLLIGQD